MLHFLDVIHLKTETALHCVDYWFSFTQSVHGISSVISNLWLNH